MVDMKKADKWYFKSYVFVVAFLCVGPFALPLVWFNPNYSLKTKIAISAVTIVLSYYIGVLFFKSVRSIIEYYRQLQ